MKHDEPREPGLAQSADPMRRAATSPKALPEPAAILLLPAPAPTSYCEPSYEEQDIDGYTIAEAHAALEAFKRRRQQA